MLYAPVGNREVLQLPDVSAPSANAAAKNASKEEV